MERDRWRVESEEVSCWRDMDIGKLLSDVDGRLFYTFYWRFVKFFFLKLFWNYIRLYRGLDFGCFGIRVFVYFFNEFSIIGNDLSEFLFFLIR